MKRFAGLALILFNLLCVDSKAQNTLPKNGFVGIQTSSPRVHLDVNGITYSNALILGDFPANSAALFHLNASISSSDSNLFVVENKDQRLLQLSSDGILRAREIIVDADPNWPDYVFEKDYNLLSLKETERFIFENGHLPGVPSAESIQTTGLDLGEMNRLLLEKIEELTLHVIQQQKEINSLKSTLEEN
jgi:hypothetical protein